MGLLTRMYGPDEKEAMAACHRQKLVDDLRREIVAEQKRQALAARRNNQILGCLIRGTVRQIRA